MRRRLRPPDDNSKRLQQRDEAIELALGRLEHEPWVTESGDEGVRACGHPLRNVAGDDRMIGRNGGALESPDNDLLKRVPFIMRVDRRERIPRLSFRIGHTSFHVSPQDTNASHRETGWSRTLLEK